MSVRQRRVLILLWVTAICLFLCASYLTFIDCGYTKVDFIDVGQGDSCFIRTNRGSTVLIDGGNNGSGKYVLSPFLKKNGANNLDAVFVSHMHSDHTAGITELLEMGYPIDQIYISEGEPTSNAYNKLFALAQKFGSQITPLKAGDTVVVDNVIFSVIASGYNGYGEFNENDKSLILRFDYGENSILFTGDATRRYENQLQRQGNIDTDFLKTGHHGSYSSSGEVFLKEVSPDIAIISVGKDNKYNHPSKQTIDTMAKLDIPVLRTDFDGTITIIMTDDDIKNISVSRERSEDE